MNHDLYEPFKVLCSGQRTGRGMRKAWERFSNSLWRQRILNSNLFLCNRGNVPTFITKTCQITIDLTLVSGSLVGAVKNWAVSDEHKFTEACNTAFKVACPTGKPRGRKKNPLVDPTTINPQNQLQMPV